MNQLDIDQIVAIAKMHRLSVKKRESKESLIAKITEYYSQPPKKYKHYQQLGHEGKDGRTYLVREEGTGRSFAMKVFRKTRNVSLFFREVYLQQIAAENGIAPKIRDFDMVRKYIVMDKLDKNLFDLFRQQQGQLTTDQQHALISLFKKLDKCGVFHGDPNPLNFMCKGDKWYAIDYGFAKPIDSQIIEKFGPHPNMMYMPIGFVLQMRKIYPQCRLEVIESFVAKKFSSLILDAGGGR